MRPIAADVARRVVCLSVCLSVLVTHVCPTKTAEPIEIPGGPKTMYWMGSTYPHGKGQFVEVIRPIEKHWECLLRCTQQTGSFNPQ